MLVPCAGWKNFVPSIKMQPKTIHIWAADLYKHSAQLEHFFQLLSKEEQERANRYQFEKDKRCFIIARGILRNIISHYLSIEPEKIQFCYNSYGKPYLNIQSKKDLLCFNLAHSGDLALYIFALDHKVGIDIEKVHPIDNFERIAEQFFTPQETLSLKSIALQDRLNTFFRYWTCKEAFIKAIGKGLSYPLYEFEVSLLANAMPTTVVKIKSAPCLEGNWSCSTLTPSPNYEAAFVWEGLSEKIEFWRFE